MSCLAMALRPTTMLMGTRRLISPSAAMFSRGLSSAPDAKSGQLSKEELDRQSGRLTALLRPRDRKKKAAADDANPMNVAMKFYMERKRAHDAFIAHERSEFELGKRHLAHMMGREEEKHGEMRQEDVDRAIQYLFPSSLEDPSARPMMKPPEEIYPKQKDAEFDLEGRPYHTFFYTKMPLFYEVLYEVVETLENCLFFNDRMFSQGKKPDPNQALDETALTGTRWMTKEEMQTKLMENIQEPHYQEFIAALERLTFQPYSYKYKDFIFRFRVETAVLKTKQEIIPPDFDEQGRAFVEALGQRKSACAKVRVTKPGSGKFTVTNIDYPDHVCDITYFFAFKERMQVMYPLQFTKLLGEVDVDAVVFNGGPSSQAGAIRFATSMCLRSLVDEETVEEMTMCGLLTQDIRVRERKKPGRRGARRGFHWRKR